MELTKVTMPANGGKVKRGSDWDLEAKHDADRCVDALAKRFPGFELVCDSAVPGTWVISAQATTGTETYNEMKLFAEGFLASASLWER